MNYLEEGMRKLTKILHNHDIKKGHNSRKRAPLMRQSWRSINIFGSDNPSAYFFLNKINNLSDIF